MSTKPNVGDKVRITDQDLKDCLAISNTSDPLTVIAVYDSLIKSEPGGNWDPWGENAMAMMEADEAHGSPGKWYVMAEDSEGEATPLASYECELVY